MKLLDAMNRGLPLLQTAPVSGLDSLHPMASRLKLQISFELEDLLSKGYWFNTQEYVLVPEYDGRLHVPNNSKAIYPLDSTALVEARGDYLFDLQNNTFVFSGQMRVRCIVALDFEVLPDYAANVVLWRATHKVYCARFDASDSTAQQLSAWRSEASALLDREHLRKRRYSTLNSGPAARFLHALRG